MADANTLLSPATALMWKQKLADVLRRGGVPIADDASERVITHLINDRCLVISLPAPLRAEFEGLLLVLIYQLNLCSTPAP